MSISPTIYEHENQNSERRSGSRAPLNWVVLVYFGQDNWGKLVDLSESGMRFEFAQPPLNHERVDFTFEAMGRLPASFGGEIISDSFQAAGDVRWTCDFERTAGVRFANLGEGSREQIRKWLSFEASTVAAANAKAEEEAPTPLPEPLEPVPAPSETLPTIYEDELQLDAERAYSSVEPIARSASPVAEKILEGPAFEDCSGTMAEEEKRLAETAGSNPRMSRAQTMGVTVGLAALVVLGGIIVILPRRNTHSVPAVERIPSPAAIDGDILGTEYGLAAGSQRPFLVEVLDTNNRQWLLWFEADSSKDAPTQAAYKSPLPASSRGASRPKQPAASPKPAAPNKFTLVAPKASQPETNSSAANSSSLAAPVVRDELHPPLEAPIASILTSRATPKPVEESTPIGGRVQLARLLKSVPPVYPPFARTSHVGGDVKLDALVDANGNVTELKVVSGPPILRQATMDAVRQWKYDPARLNGQPVALHLGVTVRFRVD